VIYLLLVDRISIRFLGFFMGIVINDEKETGACLSSTKLFCYIILWFFLKKKQVKNEN